MNSPGKPGEPLILVLMAVYNGEKFLQQQVDSILAQTQGNLHIICRDDGSTDSSLQILQRNVVNHPGRVQLLQDDKGNLGAAGCFSWLMQLALQQAGDRKNVYIALADQDDVWHPDKLKCCLQAMQQAESVSPDTPVLVHSDLRVVDAGTREISPSFVDYQGLRPGKTGLVAQLLSNTVTGCTTLINVPLLEKSLPVPDGAIMHDWWLSLVASAFGRRVFLTQPLVDYRQHGANTLGAKQADTLGMDADSLRRILRTRETGSREQIFDAMALQAERFLEQFASRISPLQRFLIRRIIALRHAGIWQRRLIYRLMTRL